MITKPMLACTISDKTELVYPLLATPKIDGIRCLKINGQALSRKFKNIPNNYIRGLLETLPDGLDGELFTEDFQSTQISVMTEDGQPKFKYIIFDYVSSLDKPYIDRLEELKKLSLPTFCEILLPTKVDNLKELNALETKYIKKGYEGVMVRSLTSPYKCGRSTNREMYLGKIKQFKDGEAKIIGFVEKLTNKNESFENELGYKSKRHLQENLVGADTLGSIMVKDLKTKTVFQIGTGFDDKTRKEIWENQSKFFNSIVTYKYQDLASKGLPRFPSFWGFRDERDL